MANQNEWGGAQQGGGFLQILGLIYLIKMIRRRRRRHRLEAAAAESGQAQVSPDHK